MQIVRIEAFLVQAEISKSYVTSWNKQGITEIRSVVLRLVTADGLVGLGETDPLVGFSSESPESVMQTIRHYLGPVVLGMDPRDLAKINLRMDELLPGSPFAKAAIDIAAHDLAGKALAVPIFTLLGGRVRDRVPMLWPIGGGSPDENVHEAVAKVKEGYGTLHIKLGAVSPDADVARVVAIRKAVGPVVAIMVDVNQGWDRATALKTIRQLERLNLSMVEQPVKAWDIESLASLQRRTQTPLSADESLSSPHEAVALVRRDAARVFSLKTGKCGGLFRTRQIAAVAEAAGLPCFVNSMIEMGISVAASLHLAASVPNLVNHGHALMSNLRIKEDILPAGSFQYDGRDILVPQDCIGLGVALDEEKLSRRTLERFVLDLED